MNADPSRSPYPSLGGEDSALLPAAGNRNYRVPCKSCREMTHRGWAEQHDGLCVFCVDSCGRGKS